MFGYILEVVQVKGSVPWALKATVDEESRYRGYRYKKDALDDLPRWQVIRWRVHCF